MSGSRLKRDELVEMVFARFWAAARERNSATIAGISVPLDDLREEIARQTGVPRQNNKWIASQLRSYEKSHGVKLFSFERSSSGSEHVCAARNMVSFVQKKHLHRPEKVRLAAALSDLVETEFLSSGTGTSGAVRLLLGAGTTLALAAEILRTRASEWNVRIAVITHNMGILQELTHRDTPKNLTVTVPRGTFDPVTWALIPEDPASLRDEDVDIMVQGTSAVYEGTLFVESLPEALMKKAMMEQTAGIKVLVLTLHEFGKEIPKGMHPFGTLQEYDLIIIPLMKNPSSDQLEAHRWIHTVLSSHQTRILHWHYEILARQTM
jgi:DeoR/GlpR family transcriptional regulator of sugar metabolism